MNETDKIQVETLAVAIHLIIDKETKQLGAELEKLKEFARHVIRVECWSIHDQDGCNIQELAKKLGLIEPHIVTKEDIAVANVSTDFSVGDTIYKFSEAMKPTGKE